MNNKNAETKKWIWIVVIAVVLLILFFMFRGGNKEVGDKKGSGNVAGPNGEVPVLPVPDEIDGLEADMGGNPDLGVDDLNALQVSQEEITG